MHLPLIGVLVVLSVIIGAIGFALRPGADKPPIVPNTELTLYVNQHGTAGSATGEPTRVVVDETMDQRNPTTVLVQLDIFAVFATPGPVTWSLLGPRSSYQPYPCPDPFDYLGTAEPDPVNSEAGQLTIGGQVVTKTELGDYTGHISRKNASNVIGLYGQAPGSVRADRLTPIAQVLISDNCAGQNDEGLFEPAIIQLTCGDGMIVANGLTWSQWGTTTATGYGNVNEVSCVPDCANGKDVAYQVDVALSKPVEAANGKEYFVQIKLTFTGGNPDGSPSQIFKDCDNTPSAPYIPACPLLAVAATSPGAT